jgi:hypothetical protein
MKIYLGFTVAGNRSSVEAAKRILSVLQLMGHDILTTHLLRDDAWDATDACRRTEWCYRMGMFAMKLLLRIQFE